MKGTIKLMHCDEVVSCRRYGSNAEKELYIKGWKKIYGPAFNRAVIVDDPIEEIKLPESNFKPGSLRTEIIPMYKKIINQRRSTKSK